MAEKEEHLTSLARDHTGFFQKQNGSKNKFSLALSPEKRQKLGRLTGYRQLSISSVLSPDSDDTGADIMDFGNLEAQEHMMVLGLILDE